MSDSVTNAYGKTDAFGKGNLRSLLSGPASSDNVRNFYNAYYGMTHGNWETLFGAGNPSYDGSNSKSTFTPIGTLLKQQTITTDTVELITADVVIQIMKQLENAMQIATKVRTLFDSKVLTLMEDISRKLILNENSWGNPVANKLNLSVINKIKTTNLQRRYVIFESTLTYFSISEVQIYDYSGTLIPPYRFDDYCK